MDTVPRIVARISVKDFKVFKLPGPKLSKVDSLTTHNNFLDAHAQKTNRSPGKRIKRRENDEM